MREHTHLPAMVGFMRKHVAQHFQANRSRPSPAVSAKLLDARRARALYAASAASSSSAVAALVKLSTPKTSSTSVEPGSIPQ